MRADEFCLDHGTADMVVEPGSKITTCRKCEQPTRLRRREAIRPDAIDVIAGIVGRDRAMQIIGDLRDTGFRIVPTESTEASLAILGEPRGGGDA